MSSATIGVSQRKSIQAPSLPWLLAPPLAAFCYPFLLKLFNARVTATGPMLVAAIELALAVAAPFGLALVVTARLGAVDQMTTAQLVARRIALLSAAAAPLYTAAGVLLYMAGDPIGDITFWIGLWGSAIAILLRAAFGSQRSSAAVAEPIAPRLRVAHGSSALAIVVLFLGMHLSNHLTGLIGESSHRHFMDMFRLVYRAKLVEPLIVLLFLFQVGSGVSMLWKYSRQRTDYFRTLQIVTGAYLVFFILGHMNSVFFYARSFANIQTDWNFATGAPTGLIKDAWNIRLVPHYLIGVFAVLAHLVLGARAVALAHDVREAAANNKWARLGVLLSAVVATAILLGMGGARLSS